MQLKTEDQGDVRLVRVAEPRIDAAIAIQFKEALRAAAGDAAPRVLLDLSEVSFLDSSGLGALVAAMKLIGPRRRLELAALQASVERVFRLTRMDTVFTIHSGVAEAIGPSPRLADAG
jgi:anti-sigma B factor antagonist